tara:strand:- start:1271 stop:1837 length:567 start_codon:yes stop_codon:yes gene_type:complete
MEINPPKIYSKVRSGYERIRPYLNPKEVTLEGSLLLMGWGAYHAIPFNNSLSESLLDVSFIHSGSLAGLFFYEGRKKEQEKTSMERLRRGAVRGLGLAAVLIGRGVLQDHPDLGAQIDHLTHSTTRGLSIYCMAAASCYSVTRWTNRKSDEDEWGGGDDPEEDPDPVLPYDCKPPRQDAPVAGPLSLV